LTGLFYLIILNVSMIVMNKIILFLLIIICNNLKLGAQLWTVTEKANMPLRTSNNAVSEGVSNGIPCVFSFAGIDSTKLFSGIHLKSFKYNTVYNIWQQLPDLPDTLGKIACAASIVKNKIYIIGGYHVYANGNEASSNKVHVFDPETNQFLDDATNIPIAIDDQVQCVWRDSLIYVITGWSNTTNIPNVQVFNPSNNSWFAGSSTPNTNVYKAFGAAGVIVGDTIFYYGGASTSNNFPAQKHLRIGIINHQNPADIQWSSTVQHVNNYRSVATTDSLGNVYFFGGSATSYNYNGIAYNGSGGVTPIEQYQYFNSSNPSGISSVTVLLPMDLRGIANVSATKKYIVGGMEQGQLVSNKTLELNFVSALGEKSYQKDELLFEIFPNPSNEFLLIHSNNLCIEYEIIDSQGLEVLTGKLNESNNKINIDNLLPGKYYIRTSALKYPILKFIKTE